MTNLNWDFEERERLKEFIAQLSEKERGVYADMIMRSLRGSWRSPRDRTFILEFIALTGSMEYYDSEELRAHIERYFEKIGRGSPDGRFWRRKYEQVDLDLTKFDESFIRELADEIPDDMTWDDYRINKEFNNA